MSTDHVVFQNYMSSASHEWVLVLHLLYLRSSQYYHGEWFLDVTISVTSVSYPTLEYLEQKGTGLIHWDLRDNFYESFELLFYA